MNQKITDLLWDYCEKVDEVDKQGNKTGKQVLKRNEEDGSFVFRNLNADEKIALAPVIDQVAELMKDQEEKQKALAQAILISRGEIDEEALRAQLRDKKNRDNFRSRNGLNVGKVNELIRKDAQKINDLLNKKIKITEKYDDANEDQYFPNLAEIEDIENDKHQINFYNKIKNVAVYMFYQDDELRDLTVEDYGELKSFEEFVEKIRSRNPHFKNHPLYREPSETEKRLDAFYKAQDDEKTSQEQLKQLEDAVWESLKAEKDKSAGAEDSKRKYIEKLKDRNCPKKVAGEDFKTIQKYHTGKGLQLLQRTINSATQNKVNGEQLKNVAEEYYAIHKKALENEAAFDENKDALNAKFDELMEVLWDAQTNTLRELAANAKDPVKVSMNEPETFLEIMGGVMNAKRNDVLFALDASVTAKMLMEMAKDKIKEFLGMNE